MKSCRFIRDKEVVWVPSPDSWLGGWTRQRWLERHFKDSSVRSAGATSWSDMSSDKGYMILVEDKSGFREVTCFSRHALVEVTDTPELWSEGDPVRQNLGCDFKSAPGRAVYALQSPLGKFVAYCCTARSSNVPTNLKELETFTSDTGDVLVPYTVWSHQKGSGKKIIEMLCIEAEQDDTVHRLVTFSPHTKIAESFHLKNGATKLSESAEAVNFEYPLG